ncbi:hypothetical protein JAAARDRAFT_198794 [Jaapia argillacea MUCL 33604]|uniref:Uncharacterized protein n=1 Tax=Jaapia argillacea MUCL 33604 TaxID=933084 RepID=A0A067PDP5_9AGAM|nr:hypothetical protein JAAARDRAFT_198794 [Jaapia argillacea MUCL 33604]
MSWRLEESEGGLREVVALCGGCEEQHIQAGINKVMNYMRLKAHVQSLLKKDHVCIALGEIPCTTLQDIYNYHVVDLGKCLSYSTFFKWIMYGSFYAYISGGGSLYLVFMIIAFNMKTEFEHLPMDVVHQLANAFCSPDASKPWGRLIMDCIIPAFTILMKNAPFQFERRLFPIISEDILDSDEVPAFDQYSFNNFQLVPRSSAWPHLLPFTFAQVPTWPTQPRPDTHHYCCPIHLLPTKTLSQELHTQNSCLINSMPVATIQVDFNRLLDSNKKYPVPVECQEGHRWTEVERERAEKGVEVKGVDDLQFNMRANFREGKHSSKDYISVSSNHFPGHYVFKDLMARH